MWAWICLIILILILYVVPKVYCATYTYIFPVDNNSGFDTVIIKTYADGKTTFRDSLFINTFPDTVSVSLNKDSSYSYNIYASWSGNDGLSSSFPDHIGAQSLPVSITNVDTVWFVYSGTWAGDGTDTFHVVAYDSLADNTIEGALVDIKNVGGVSVFNRRTNGSGVVTAILQTGNTYYIYGYGGGNAWDIDTVIISAGATDTMWGHTLFDPPAAAAASWVNMYLDVGTGWIDSATGYRIPLTEVEFTLTLSGVEGLNDGSWGFIPVDSSVRPDANGRVLWSGPANTIPGLEDSFYELRYKRRGHGSLASGLFKRFIVDTIPDPLNIIDAEVR